MKVIFTAVGPTQVVGCVSKVMAWVEVLKGVSVHGDKAFKIYFSVSQLCSVAMGKDCCEKA